jgi:hypothetical protein
MFSPLKSTKEKRKTNKAPKTTKESWKQTEQGVADFLNNVPSLNEARRSRRSGAMWFEKGDVVDNVVFNESKDRAGTKLVNGDRSFNIRKTWIDKAQQEALDEGKPMLFTAKFKDDPPDRILALMFMSDMAELITHYKALKFELELKEKQIEKLKKDLKKK